ncbi:MAG: hypothetical protein C0613_03480 [Desulfobulbaceae bacterium]|nr:MAG: hypothetical protein C0613_03480 [Desulfobulbaceae bacterium]
MLIKLRSSLYPLALAFAAWNRLLRPSGRAWLRFESQRATMPWTFICFYITTVNPPPDVFAENASPLTAAYLMALSVYDNLVEGERRMAMK